MKNCLEFVMVKLTQFIVYFGVFEVLDALNQFQVITNIIMLDEHYLKITDLAKVKFGATRGEGSHLRR